MLRQIINIIMGILYAAMGGFIMWKKWFVIELSDWAAIALGIIMILYGLFRIYRAIISLRTKDY